MYNLFEIKYLNNESGRNEYMAVVAERMSDAINCFETNTNINPISCDCVDKYNNSVIIDVKNIIKNNS